MRSNLIPKLTSYPTITLLFIWMAVPLGMTIYFSFLRYSLMYPDVREFTGLLNYEYFLTDFAFLEALWNTFVLVFSVLIFSIIFGTGFAVLLNQNFFGRGLARVLAIAPFFIMPTVSALIWKNLFMNPVSGLFAWLLSLFGLGPIDWFTHVPMISIIIIVSWQWTPFATLILLTSLQSVDKDQLEAVKLDGANSFQAFRYVVLPHLSRPIAIIILIETIPCKEFTNFNGISQGIFCTSSTRGWGIFLLKFSYSIQELMLFLWTNSGSLVCHITSGKRF